MSVPVIPVRATRIGDGHRALIMDMLPETKLYWAVRVLFLAKFDTVDIAHITKRTETEICDLLQKAPGPSRLEVIP